MLIACDFDATISDLDTTDLLLSKLGRPEWREVEEEWKSGKIGSAECMRRQTALIDASKEEVDAIIDTVKIEPYFKELAATAKELSIPLVILSDGIDYVINRVLARHRIYGLEVRANHLVSTGARSYELTFPNSMPGCPAGNCKCSRIGQQELLTIYIGDGRSDFCASGKADLVIAKASLLEYAKEKQLFHIPFTGFSAVSDLVRRLHLDISAYPGARQKIPEQLHKENSLSI